MRFGTYDETFNRVDESSLHLTAVSFFTEGKASKKEFEANLTTYYNIEMKIVCCDITIKRVV